MPERVECLELRSTARALRRQGPRRRLSRFLRRGSTSRQSATTPTAGIRQRKEDSILVSLLIYLHDFELLLWLDSPVVVIPLREERKPEWGRLLKWTARFAWSNSWSFLLRSSPVELQEQPFRGFSKGRRSVPSAWMNTERWYTGTAATTMSVADYLRISLVTTITSQAGSWMVLIIANGFSPVAGNAETKSRSLIGACRDT